MIFAFPYVHMEYDERNGSQLEAVTVFCFFALRLIVQFFFF